MSDELRSLVDKRALDEAIFRVLKALDEGRWDAFQENFTGDAEFVLPDHTVSTGVNTRTIYGPKEFIPVVSAVLAGFDAVQHHVTNMEHRIAGDEGLTNCYLINEQFLGDTPGANSISIGGRYEITSRREGPLWKLTRWRFIPAWTRGNPSLFEEAAQKSAVPGNPG